MVLFIPLLFPHPRWYMSSPLQMNEGARAEGVSNNMSALRMCLYRVLYVPSTCCFILTFFIIVITVCCES